MVQLARPQMTTLTGRNAYWFIHVDNGNAKAPCGSLILTFPVFLYHDGFV